MLKAKQAIELSKLEKKPVKLHKECEKALNKGVRETIARGKQRVEILLEGKELAEEDEILSKYLVQNGYTVEEVRSFTVDEFYPKISVKFKF